MKVTVTKEPKNTASLVIEVEVEELKPYLEKAASHLSGHHKVPGFRPGKAPYAVMQKLVGDDVIYHEAFASIVRGTFPKAVEQEKLETVGSPRIAMQKIAAGNPMVYKATVDLLPEVQLGEYKALKVKKHKVTADPSEVDEMIERLRKSRGKEKLVLREAKMDDKVEIDFKGYMDKVPVEGATSKTHPLVLGSKQFVPGFEEQIVGIKPGEEKDFTLRFPADYYQKNMANRDVEFHVKLVSVYEIELPTVDDAFAQSFGEFRSVEDLRKHLEQNLIEEKKHKERERYEAALLDKIVEISTFGEMSDAIVDSEVDKMVEELKHAVAEQGMEWNKYLETLKKPLDEIKKKFRPKAEKRLQLALATRKLAEEEKIEVSDDEIKKEVEDSKKMYKSDPEVLAGLSKPEYFRYLKNVLTSKRVYQYLDDVMGFDE